MTYNEFVEDIMAKVAKCPKNWRKGQSVFNMVDEHYGIARYVQFVDHIDCFYDNDYIDEFLTKAYIKLTENERSSN